MSDPFTRRLGEPQNTPSPRVALLAATLLVVALTTPVAILAAALLTLAIMTCTAGAGPTPPAS